MIKKQKKKIVIIGPAYPYRGGNALFVSYLYHVLKSEYDVKIYNYKLLYPNLLFPGVTQYDKSQIIVKRAPNVRIVNSINPANWVYVAKKLKQEKADLIIFDWWQPFFGLCHWAISQLIKKTYRNNILFITENFVSHEGRFIDRFLTRIGLTHASYFIALSEQVFNELQLFTKKKILRSELPIYYYKDQIHNTNKSQMGYKNDDIILLFFGYVRKYKGLDILIEAFPLVLKNIPQAHLLVVGEFYDDPDYYFHLIQKFKIENNVKIVNRYVANEEVNELYSMSDLVVLPYRSATQSGILNIAYGFSKPVVVTNVGGLGEFVQDKKTGIIVEPNSPQAIAEGIKMFFSLRSKVDFSANIKKLIKENRFNKLPQLIAEILIEPDK